MVHYGYYRPYYYSPYVYGAAYAPYYAAYAPYASYAPVRYRRPYYARAYIPIGFT